MEKQIKAEIKSEKQVKKDTNNTQAMYTKQQLVNSKQFEHHKDLLEVLLNDNENVTIEQVNDKIENFLNKEVK